MKSRFALLAAVCFVLLGGILLAHSSETPPTPPRGIETAASRGGERTPLLVPETTTTTPETTTTTSTTTTVPPTTTTIKPKPKPTTTTAPKPKPPVTAASSGDSRRWMPLIQQYSWDSEKAYRIMMCESGGNPNAINKSSGATGLFQIHPGGSQYLNPEKNVATAYAKYQARGWAPWVCRA